MAASVAVTLRAVVSALEDEDLPLRRVRDDAGLVETDYVARGQRRVRYIFAVEPDTLGRGAQLTVFALTRSNGAEGATPEQGLAADHPAAAFARKLIERIERRAIGR